MQLSALHPLLVPLYCAILSVASPAITSNTAGPNLTPEDPPHIEDSVYNATISKHSISIAAQGSSTEDYKERIVIDDLVHLKLECNLVVDSKDLQINVSWRHGKKEINSNLYTSNNTDNQWHTAYEFVVTDINKTGDYMCIFSSVKEVSATFNLQVPEVHGGSKALISYIGDFIVLKCDTSNHKPLKWLWYKVIENEQVLLYLSLEPKKYHELSKNSNETKLRITDLSESDNGSYVCKAVFTNVESEGQVQLKVLSYMVPLKVFLVIAAEVVTLVTVILVYEIISKKKKGQEDVKKDNEEMAQLKSEDNSIAEVSTARQRKV
ncbi:embigin [Rhinoderma darwinii]|uniref:embigin n=1 Tax=Rhinoderma darwinii TaxID=43563 RepID=UPI003F66C4ED